MKKKTASRPLDLVDVGEHQAAPIPKQREQLATLLGALLREIAAALSFANVGRTSPVGLRH